MNSIVINGLKILIVIDLDCKSKPAGTLMALRAIIQETVPNCTELLNYEMPA